MNVKSRLFQPRLSPDKVKEAQQANEQARLKECTFSPNNRRNSERTRRP